ncbi:hypothetical protein CC86DRAFT_400672 [Ophiobolus disseminans]|uniref:Uncharacterized protein n=1 Tax=Ophiobolus disseminans TaxID=1469910 RepID=A0A6A7AGU0_9PLEO|nr:hypothetical protein CC86DRAFT_400672 [Ophiobolus disseminans]
MNSFGPAIAESNRIRAAAVANDTHTAQLAQRVHNCEAEIARLRGIIERSFGVHHTGNAAYGGNNASGAGPATGSGSAHGSQYPSNSGGGYAATIASSEASTTPRAGPARPNVNNKQAQAKTEPKDDTKNLPLVVDVDM